MYDLLIIGQISKDINIDHYGTSVNENGGAVLYAGFAAGNMGHKVAVLAKGNSADLDSVAAFAQVQNVDVYPLESSGSTSIKNVYHTPDKEQRTSTALGRIDTYSPGEIPPLDAKIYYIAGLMNGDVSDKVLDKFYGERKIAFDVQGTLRHAGEDGLMSFYDWPDKKYYMPKIDFFKADAREAYVMTGTDNREDAARMMYDWGAKEIMITHHTEVIIFDGRNICRQPIRSRNLSGRSGRGDTCFGTYIAERLYNSVEQSLLTATATVSMKMERRGPFSLGRQDVENYIREFY
jgi:sugar/nucleoside kinase (ribokinase family)